MPLYLGRVELHRAPADGEDYKKLHAEMASRGWSRLIRSEDGSDYHLPPAQYFANNTENRVAMLNRARAAAEAVGYTVWAGSSGKTYAAIVTEGPSNWVGLPKAT